MSTYILKLCVFDQTINPLCINPTKWLNTLKQFVGNLPTNCFSVFDHFVKLALKGLKSDIRNIINIRSFITSTFFGWGGGRGVALREMCSNLPKKHLSVNAVNL